MSERVGLFANDRAVLVHGDAHFNNVLWDAEQGLTLIDFEVATHLAADRELEAACRHAAGPGRLCCARSVGPPFPARL
ncbi:MAG: hypothetical protein CMQ24_06900 [Gammaproteobacteria bacterium]|nr:hypothetical protein [Gammaproteobacteria bacterium]